jgi:competence protein ComEC
VPHDDRLDVPALYPLLAYVAGLTIGPALVNLRFSTLGCAAIVLLTVAAKRPRPALVAALFATGLLVATSTARRAAREDADLGALAPDRFASVEAPIRRGWRRDSHEHFSLVADRFSAIEGGQHIAVERTLVVTASFTPASIETEAVVAGEGFLRCGEGGTCFLSIKSPRLMHYEGLLSSWSAAGLNRRMNNALARIAAGHPRHRRAVVLAQAIALGRSDQLPDDLRESYRRGGIYHLLVFSGMQIGLAAALLAATFRLMRAARGGDWALLALSCGAPFFAGNEPSVARASWMIGLYSISRLFGRPTRSENLLFVSALIRLLAHPEELTEAGFALTYAAAGGLLIVGNAFSGAVRNRFARPLLFGAGAEIATLPLTLLFFNQYVAAGSIVTLLASPLIAAMLGLAAIAATLALFAPAAAIVFLVPVAHLDTVCTWMASLVGDRMGLAGMAAAPEPLAVCGSFAVLLVALPFLGVRARAPVFLFLLSIPIVSAALKTAGPARLDAPTAEILDVGQGDALLLRTRSGSILIDGGGRSDDPRWGRARFLPMLLDRGVTSLEAIALTHPDPDHCGGLISVLEHLRVHELWISTPHLDSSCGRELMTRAIHGNVRVLSADRIERIGLKFDVITPRLRFKRAYWNNSSVVLGVGIGNRRLLAAGDIEKEAERMYADEMAPLLRADVLKVPHHGSRSSTTAAFFDAVAPRVAVISCGRRNRFGHPAAEVVERLSGHALVTARTDLSGSILLRFEGGRLTVVRQFDTPSGRL